MTEEKAMRVESEDEEGEGEDCGEVKDGNAEDRLARSSSPILRPAKDVADIGDGIDTLGPVVDNDPPLSILKVRGERLHLFPLPSLFLNIAIQPVPDLYL